MNPSLLAIPGSAIRAINALKQPGDIDLGLGEPTLRAAVAPFEAATAWIREHGCPYTANAGAADLRGAIAARCAPRSLSQPDNACVTMGSQEALYLAIKTVCDPAVDEALVVTPAYPAYEKLCALEGLPARTVQLQPETGFKPDAQKVLEAVGRRTRLILLATPANPTGRVWPDAELDRLAEGLSRLGEARPWVLVDEVYRALTYVQPVPRPFADRYDRTLVVGSLSKSHALTGLRLGWLLAPAEVITAATKAHQFIVTAASTFSQRVAHAVLTDAAPLDAHRAHYAARREALCSHLTELGLRHVPPEGAFYVMVGLPPALARDSSRAAHGLLARKRVVTVPGSAFGAEGWLRLSWVAEPEAVREGLVRLSDYLCGL